MNETDVGMITRELRNLADSVQALRRAVDQLIVTTSGYADAVQVRPPAGGPAPGSARDAAAVQTWRDRMAAKD